MLRTEIWAFSTFKEELVEAEDYPPTKSEEEELKGRLRREKKSKKEENFKRRKWSVLSNAIEESSWMKTKRECLISFF